MGLASGPDLGCQLLVAPDDAAAQPRFGVDLLPTETGVDGCLLPFAIGLRLGGSYHVSAFLGGKDVVEDACIVAVVFGQIGRFEVDDLFFDLWSGVGEEVLGQLVGSVHGFRCQGSDEKFNTDAVG